MRIDFSLKVIAFPQKVDIDIHPAVTIGTESLGGNGDLYIDFVILCREYFSSRASPKHVLTIEIGMSRYVSLIVVPRQLNQTDELNCV